MAFSTDGKQLASGSGNVITPDNILRVWDVQTGAGQGMMQSDKGNVDSVAFSPDSSLIASGTDSGAVELWDAETHAEVHEIPAHLGDVLSLAFSLSSASPPKTATVPLDSM